MLQFKSLIRPTLLLSAAIAAAACAPKDEQLTGGRNGNGGGNNNNGKGVSTQSLEGRELDFAQYTLGQTVEIRRMMDVALALPERSRVELDRQLPVSAVGNNCRFLKKLSPAPDAADAKVEWLTLDYQKCTEALSKEEVNKNKEQIIKADKDGSELYTISYASALPKEGDAERVYPFPTSVVARMDGVNVVLQHGSHANNKIQLTQSPEMNARFVGEDAETLLYTVSFAGRDKLVYDIRKIRRRGEVKTELQQVEVKVDKASRKVVSVFAPKMSFDIDFEQFDMKGNYMSDGLEAYSQVNANYDFASKAPLSLATDSCALPKGEFAIVKYGFDKKEKKVTETKIGTFSSVDGKVTLQSEGQSTPKSKDLKLCEKTDEKRMNEPLIIDLLSAAFL